MHIKVKKAGKIANKTHFRNASAISLILFEVTGISVADILKLHKTEHNANI
jgi:hypothetical protein